MIETQEQRRARLLADFQEALHDQDALLRDPDEYTAPLIEQVTAAAGRGDISAEDLREALEWAEAAQAWALEELLTRELNQ